MQSIKQGFVGKTEIERCCTPLRNGHIEPIVPLGRSVHFEISTSDIVFTSRISISDSGHASMRANSMVRGFNVIGPLLVAEGGDVAQRKSATGFATSQFASSNSSPDGRRSSGSQVVRVAIRGFRYSARNGRYEGARTARCGHSSRAAGTPERHAT